MEEDIFPRSEVAGVVWCKNINKWSASIGIDKKHCHLGIFKDLDEAVLARYEAEQRMDRKLYIEYSPAERYLINKGLIKD